MAAKMGSSLQKPNQQTMILPEALRDFISCLDPLKLPNCGQKTVDRLKSQFGVEDVAGIRKLSRKTLVAAFGKHTGTNFSHMLLLVLRKH